MTSPPAMLYQILFWHNQQWVDFVLKGRELSVISQKEADFLRSCSIGIEDVAKVISYFADDICWGPPSSFWKVIGTRDEKLPSFIGSTYEVRGQETSAPPLAAAAQ
jgi:hypothetical protein